jgi:glycosyltransferase involved in cell wall biosynthesis
VTVLTSRFHPALPARERIDGVDILRCPVVAKLSKGVVMPLFPFYAWSQAARHDVLNVHMPQLEAAWLAACGRAHRRPVVLTYHCNLRLPQGAFNRVVERLLVPLNHLAARLADRIVVTTADYADSSRYLRPYRPKVRVIRPLIQVPPADPALTRQLAERYHLNGRTRIGFAARFAAEKGVEYLLEALPKIIARVPDACIAFTGAHKDTVGEADYHRRLQPLLERYRDRVTFLDLLTPEEMPSFFSLCQVLAVTSLNSTESFGLVQAEAMLCGTPVVATDLPGVRQAVRETGMGEVVAPCNADALADALVRVIQNPDRYRRPRQEVARAFDLEEAIGAYEQLFEEVTRDKQKVTRGE